MGNVRTMRPRGRETSPEVAARLAEIGEGIPALERLRLMRPNEVARMLGLSRPTVYRLLDAGALRSVKLDGADRGATGRAGAVRVRLAEVVRFIAEREALP
jgi:excisionase family DNA binding protein